MLNLSEYRNHIKLDTTFNKKETILNTAKQNKIIDLLLNELREYVLLLGNVNTYNNDVEKRHLLRAVLNTLPAFTLNEEKTLLLDHLLQSELSNIQLTDCTSITSKKTINNTQVKLWKGDICSLKIDAIVNAANSAMQGCFQPLHACIDNAIHSCAGVQLRDDCAKIIKLQKHAEPTGTAKITRAYNLPSAYVLHTVGPIIQGSPTKEHEQLLSNVYINCLEIAKETNNIKSIAFCCVSTGVFGYPSHLAAQVAYKTTINWLELNPDIFDTIVFNVFSEGDKEIYESIMK